jgi:phytoene synthase
VSDLVPASLAAGLDAGRKASNLAFGLRALPPDRRRDALVFYRFCRLLDDIADSPLLSPDEKTRALAAWEAALASPAALPPDLAGLVARHGIDPALLREILAGVRADLTVRRYATFADARQYCWRVASAVGLVSIRIFGCVDSASEAYAESLGLALQWTNILRDVGEDAANDRIYLPLDELARFGVSEADILARRPSPAFLALMRFQAARAEEFFADAQAPAADRKALVPAEIMRAIYATLLRRMRADGFRVLEKRYRVNRLEKLLLAARAMLFPANGQGPVRIAE